MRLTWLAILILAGVPDTVPHAICAEQPVHSQPKDDSARGPTAQQGYTFAPDTGELIPMPPAELPGGFPSPGPDVIVGEVSNTTQFGRAGTVGSGTVGLSIRTVSCNKGDAPYNWFALPDVDHPMIAMNLYRLQTVSGTQRFEHIGYSWIKHAFSALQGNVCGFGCQSSGSSTQLGVGCSDPYSSSLNAGQCGLGPRGVANPYTGVIPAGANLAGSPCSTQNFPSRDHRSHTHNGISHRLQVSDTDLTPSLNPGARYFSEAQYVGPHEFTDTDAFNAQNMHNNVAYREVGVSPPDQFGVYTFTDMGATISETPALSAWEGADVYFVEPEPFVDGRALLASKAAPIGGDQWHYEFIVYNMNLDRAINSISVPLPAGATVSNIEFHAPPHHAPEAHAPTYSNDPWPVDVSGGAVTWSTETFNINPDANAIRWGTAYNFRFETDLPPEEVTVTLGMFKTADTVEVLIPIVEPDCFIPEDCDDSVPCNGTEQCVDGSCFAAPFDDCNENALPDLCDIEDGTSPDDNANTIPDECENLGDADNDTDVDLADYDAFQDCVDVYDGVDPPECVLFDFDGDGDVDYHDWGGFQRAFTGSLICPVMTGTGTNPGPGSGNTINVTVSLTGDVGPVVIHPCIPIFGCIPITLQAGNEGLVVFECNDQIDFGEVIFHDGVNPPNNVGQVTFDLGTDFACGQPARVTFSLPCGIELSQE